MSSSSMSSFESAKAKGDTAGMTAARQQMVKETGANPSYGQGSFNSSGTWVPSGGSSPIITAPSLPSGYNSNINYKDNPNWMGNKYNGVQWNANNKTITDSFGKTYKEGEHFTIGPDNRAYAISTGGGEQAPAQPKTTVEEMQRQWEQFLNQRPDMEQYMNMFNIDMPKPNVPTLSHDEAMRRAAAVWQPYYKQKMQDTLEDVDNDTVRRGFFGQLPAGVLKRATAAQVENAENQSIGQLATQMMGQSEDNAFRAEQMAFQQAQFLHGLRQSAYNAAQNEHQNRINNIISMMGLAKDDQRYQDDYSLKQQQLAMQIQQIEEEKRRWEAEYGLNKQQVDYATGKPYYKESGGSGSVSKPTAAAQKTALSNQALQWINTYKDRFSGQYPAKNMYEQVKRNIAAGTVDVNLGYEVLRQLENLYME